MALRTILAPLAAALFVATLAWSPAEAALFGGGKGGSQSAAPSAGSRSGSGGGTFHGGGRRSAPAHRGYSRHGGSYRSGRYRHYRGGAGIFVYPWAFGAPYPYYDPYYYEDDGDVVCRYRRVRRHGRWVLRRYCWREYW